MIAAVEHPARLTSDVSTSEATAVDMDTLYREHADAIYCFCLSQLADPAAAEDVAAEVFASAMAALPRTRLEPGGARPWLFRIARNGIIDHHRSKKKGRALVGRLRRGDSAMDVEALALLNADLRALLTAAAGLRPQDRLLIGLRVAAGLGYPEIAATIGKKESAAKMATHRAVARLRLRLEEMQ